MSFASASPWLSIVIPVFNEDQQLAESVRRIQAFMEHKTDAWELVISDDGSSDDTAAVAQKLVGGRIRFFSNPVNLGKGAAVRRGVQECHGKYVLVTDADLSVPVKEVDKLIRVLDEGADVAIGSRFLREKGSDVQQSFRRWLSGRIFNIFVQLIAVRGFWDTQCGFKCFKKDAAQLLFKDQKMDGFSFDVEILYLAKKHRLRVDEVPVMWRQGMDSRVSLVHDSIKMVKDLFKIRGLHNES